MRFAFTDDQLAFRDAGLADALAKEAAQGVGGGWDALAAMGVAGLCVDDAHGGMGLSLLDLEPILEEAGRACLAGPLVDTAAVAPVLLGHLTGEVVDGLLSGIAGGTRSVSVCLSPGVPVEVADVVLVLDGRKLAAVDRGLALAEGRRLDSVDPARVLVALDQVPEGAVLVGTVTDAVADTARQVGSVATAAVLVGLADRMLSMTVDYVIERRQFGVPIGSFQAVKHHLADALTANEFAKPPVRFAAATLSGIEADPAHPVPSEPAVASAMAKATASDAAMVVASQALQCHGAIGYTVEYDLHRYLKRTWALAEAWGSAAWHRERLARRLLDKTG